MYCYLDKFWNRYYSEYVKVSTALTEPLTKRTYFKGLLICKRGISTSILVSSELNKIPTRQKKYSALNNFETLRS